MKSYISILLKIISLIILFNLQIYLICQEGQTQLNFLLVAYVNILFTNCSITGLTILAFMLDGLTFMITGVVGLTTLFLVPLSWIALYLKNNMYNKVIIPALFIFNYAIFYNIVLFTALPEILCNHAIIKKIYFLIHNAIWSTIINYILFIIIWKIRKQPFHE